MKRRRSSGRNETAGSFKSPAKLGLFRIDRQDFSSVLCRFPGSLRCFPEGELFLRPLKSFAAIVETLAPPLPPTGGRFRYQFKKTSAIHFAEIVGRSYALRAKNAPARFGRLK